MPSATIELPARYRDPHHVASGAMAAVYAAEDAILGRRVAIKVLADHVAEDPAAVRRFQREARAAAKVSQHPHVVTIYDVGEHDGRPFIVMELMEGGSLAAVLRDGRPRRGEAVRWISEAAQALDAGHEHGIVHRDVKPGNLLLDDRRRLGVADFGIARLAFESAVTMTGQVLGTAAYVAPEQADGSGATDASDRYSLAVVAFELLTGERPFTGGTFAAQARQHLEAEPPAASERSGDLPRAVDGVLTRGLAKDPAERWPTASDFAQALQRAADEEETAATRPLAATRRHRPAAAAAAGAAAAGAAAPASAAARGAPSAARSRRDPARPVAVSRARHWRRWVPAALVGLIVLLVAVFALAGGDGDDPAQQAREAARSAPERQQRDQAREEPAAGAQESGPSVAALNDQGFALMNQGRYDEAIPLLQRAVRQCGDSRETTCAYALFNLGSALRLAGRPEEAIPILERRLAYGNQTDVVQAELDAARRDAGQTSAPAPTGGGSEDDGGSSGKGKGNGKDKKGKEGD